jgi:hypothetical protein
MIRSYSVELCPENNRVASYRFEIEEVLSCFNPVLMDGPKDKMLVSSPPKLLLFQ